MKVEVKKLDKLKRVIKVDIEGEDFLKDKEEGYREISKKLKVSGFRPGTAPLDVLEKQHGKFLKEEFLKNYLPFCYSKVLEESKIVPASMPRIYDVEFSGDSLSFYAELEVKPELDINESVYKGIKIKEDKPVVKDDEIEKLISNFKERMKKVINKDFQDGDQELARWSGYPDSETFREAIKGEIYIQKLRERRHNIDNLVSRHLIKNVKVDIPKSEVERHHEELVAREINNLNLRGIPEADVEKYKKELEEKLKPAAENEIKLFYILEAIAKKENMKVENNLGEIVLGFILSQANYG